MRCDKYECLRLIPEGKIQSTKPIGRGQLLVTVFPNMVWMLINRDI